MEEAIQSILDQQFTEYERYHAWIYLAILAITAVIALLSNRWLKRDIDRLGLELRKNEIKFSRYHEDQVEAYKTLYQLFRSYHSSMLSLFIFTDRNAGHKQYKARLNKWFSSQKELQSFFKYNRILFPENTCIKVDESFTAFRRFSAKVAEDRNDINDFEDHYQADFNAMYGEPVTEIDEIRKRANKLRNTQEYKLAGVKMWSLIKELEADYRELVSEK